MDEEQLMFLFENYASEKGFSDYNEFKDVMSDEGARKVFFENSNSDLGFTDYNEFNSVLGIDDVEGEPVNFTEGSVEQPGQPTEPLKQDITIEDGTLKTPEIDYNLEAISDEKLSKKYGQKLTFSVDPFAPKKKEIVKESLYTPSQIISDKEQEIVDLNKEIDKIPENKSTRMAGDPGIIRTTKIEEDLYNKRRDLIKTKNQKQKQLNDLINSNEDILAAESGSSYFLGDQEITRSKLRNFATSMEYTLALEEGGKDFDIKVENDEQMKDFILSQKEAASIGLFEKSGRGFVATTKDILIDGIDRKSAELGQLLADVGIGSEEHAAMATALYSFQPEAASKAIKDAILEVNRDPREKKDFGDAFLRNYSAQIENTNAELRGIQLERSYDVIDLLQEGEVGAASEEIVKMSVESLPYTFVAMAGWGGTALIANSVQSREYYDLRNQGVSKEKSLASSGLASVIETVDAVLEAKLFKGNLSKARKIAGKTGITAGYTNQQIKDLSKNVFSSYVKEMPTELAQGTLGELNRQWATDKPIDFQAATRAGLIESLAAAPTSTIIASPSMAKLVYAPVKKYKDLSKIQNAIGDFLFRSAETTDNAERKILINQSKMLVNDYIAESNKIEQTAKKSTEEESNTLKQLTLSEFTLERTLENTDNLSPETVEVLQSKLDAIGKQKSELINSIEGREDVAVEDIAAPEEVIEEQEYNQFVDEGVVSEERIQDIANKVRRQQELTPRELEIFTDKTSEVNQKIAEFTPTEEVSETVQAISPLPEGLKNARVARVGGTFDKGARGEKINEKEIEEAQSVLMDELNEIENSNLPQQQKDAASAEVEKLFNELENYEFTTETKTRKITQKRPTRVVREGVKEQTKSPQERSVGRKINIVEGTEFTQEGFTPQEGETIVLEEQDGKIVLQAFDKYGNRTTAQELELESVNDLELVETLKDDNGKVIGATVRNKNNDAEVFSIMDEQLALDYAIDKTKAEVGEMSIEEESVFKEYEEVKKIPSTKKPIKKTPKEKTTEETTTEVVTEEKTTEESKSEPKEATKTDKKITEEEKSALDDILGIGGPKKSIYTENKSEADTRRLKRVDAALNKIQDSFQKIFPNLYIGIAEDSDMFAKFAEEQKTSKESRSKGVFTPIEIEGEPKRYGIILNPDFADVTTAFHEAFHALMKVNGFNNEQARAVTSRMIKSVQKGATPGLNESLEIFVSQYKTPEQSEEYMSELFGILAYNYSKQSGTVKGIIKRWLRKLAEIIGLKPKNTLLSSVGLSDSDAATVNMLNVLADKMSRGKVLSKEDVTSLRMGGPLTVQQVAAGMRMDEEHGDLVEGAEGDIPSNIEDDGPSIDLIRKSKQQINRGGIDISSIKRGSINELSGANAFVFAADQATYGKIKSPSGLEYDFFGGYLYPYGSGLGWAFTEEKAGNNVLKKVRESDGVGLVMSQAPDGITGSYSFYEYLNAEINNAIEKGASPSELLKYINEKLKITKVAKTLASKGLPTQIKSLDELPSLMPFEGKNKVSYEVRGAFGKSFFSAKSQEMFGIPPLTKTAKVDIGVLDYVNDPSLKNVEYGDIVSAIQFDKDSKVERLEKSDPSYHPSYPFVITGKPIMVFNNSVDVRKVFPNAKPKSEKASQVPLGKREKPQAARSAMGGQYVAKVPSKVKVGEAKIGITPETESIKKSKRQPEENKKLKDAIEFAKDNNIPLKELNDYLLNNGYTQQEIDEATPVESKPKESIQKLINKISRLTDNNEARAIVAKELRELLKDSKLSQFSKRTINKVITSLKNTNVSNMQKMLDKVEDAISDDERRVERIKRYKDRSRAIKRIANIGPLKELQDSLVQMLGIDPKYLSEDARKEYDTIISDILNINRKYDKTSRDTFKAKIDLVLNSYNIDSLRAKAIADRINELIDTTKTLNTNLARLEKDGYITKEERDLITRFKSLLDESSVADPMAGYTEEEIELYKEMIKAEKREAIEQDFIETLSQPQSAFYSTDDAGAFKLSEEERSYIKEANSITLKDIQELSLSDAKSLVRALEAMKAGFLVPGLFQGVIKVRGVRGNMSIPLTEIKESGFIDKISSKISSSILNRGRKKKITGIGDRLRSAPTKNYEQIFKVEKELLSDGSKRFKATNIYKSLFKPTSSAFSKAEQTLTKIEDKLKNATALLSRNQNERFIQKAKVMVFQIQREHDSNLGNKEVNQAKDWINATIKDKDTKYKENEIRELEKIRDGYLTDDQVDANKLYDSLTTKEKKFLETIDGVYDELTSMARIDAAVQGMPFIHRENYIHLPKSGTNTTEISNDLDSLLDSFMNASVKNKAAIQRTGKTHSISFDPVSNAYAAARKISVGYHMYPVIKSARVAFSGLKNRAETEFQKNLVNELESIYDKIINSQYKNVTKDKILIDNIINYLTKAGYYSQLGGLVKAASELGSNTLHAVMNHAGGIVDGYATIVGVDTKTIDKALENTQTTQMARLTKKAKFENKDVESKLMSKEKLFNAEEMTGELAASAKTVGKVAALPFKAVAKLNESLITKPDELVIRPLFVGVFQNKFRQLTGQKLNWEKLANDESYRDRFQEAINQASEEADTAVIDTAASINPFDTIPSNISDPDAGAIKKAMQIINRYMTNFRVFEYYSAVKGVQNLLGKGEISRGAGSMLLASTLTRMAVYRLGIDYAFGLIFSMLGMGEDEDEIKEEDITRNVLSGIVTLAFGRNLGNLSQTVINFGIEYANKEFGEGITWDSVTKDGEKTEYDPYKDSMVFSKISVKPSPGQDVAVDAAIGFTGPLAPVIKTTVRGVTLANRSINNERKKSRDKNRNELFFKTPFDMAGSTGFIPDYKDLKRINDRYWFGGDRDTKKEVKGKGTGRTVTQSSRSSSTNRTAPKSNRTR